MASEFGRLRVARTSHTAWLTIRVRCPFFYATPEIPRVVDRDGDAEDPRRDYHVNWSSKHDCEVIRKGASGIVPGTREVVDENERLVRVSVTLTPVPVPLPDPSDETKERLLEFAGFTIQSHLGRPSDTAGLPQALWGCGWWALFPGETVFYDSCGRDENPFAPSQNYIGFFDTKPELVSRAAEDAAEEVLYRRSAHEVPPELLQAAKAILSR